jgi:hypothetical protein
METRKIGTMLLVLVASATLGCSYDGASDLVERKQSPLFFWQAFFGKELLVELVGRGLNGTTLNGKELEGHMVVAVSLEDVVMPNGKVKDATLKRTLFRGSHAQGKEIGNRDFVGARFTGYLDDGTPITLRIDDAVADDQFGETFYRYLVSYQAQEGWLPMCDVDDDGMPVPAVPLNGVWNYESGVAGGGGWVDSDAAFTFACDGFVLSKCVSMGYLPWAEGKVCDSNGNGSDCYKTTLAAHHQACTRALRADYCGDGTSFTEDGALLNLYDGISIRTDSEDWTVEAEWDDAGARCVNQARFAALPMPPCMADLALDDCGEPEHFQAGTLVVTELENLDVAE